MMNATTAKSGCSISASPEDVDECTWEEIEDDLSVLFENDEDSIDVIHSLYTNGRLRQREVLFSLARLALSCNQDLEDAEEEEEEDTAVVAGAPPCPSAPSSSTVHSYAPSLLTLVAFLSDDDQQGAARREVKLAGLRALFALRGSRYRHSRCRHRSRSSRSLSPMPPAANNTELKRDKDELNISESSAVEEEDMLAFITERDYRGECPAQHPSEEVLLWELRAIYRYLFEKKRLDREEALRRRIKEGADLTASMITRGASIVESKLNVSTKIVTTEIDGFGTLIKGQLGEASPSCLETTTILDSSDTGIEAAALEYTGTARRASDSARIAVKQAMTGLREATVKGIETASKKIEEGGLASRIVPDPNGRSILAAAGQIGITSLGAIAVVGEAVYDTTSSIIKKTADVTADVAEHKYGPTRGQLMRDTNSTVGNMFKTVEHVGMFKGRALSTAVAKDTGKKHLQREASEELPGDSSERLLQMDRAPKG